MTEVADRSSSTARRLVFVSHSGPDTWIAQQAAREIEMCGAVPFLDEAQIDAGADFEEEILDFLQRAHELVVLLTHWALQKPYVWAEFGAACGGRIPISSSAVRCMASRCEAIRSEPVLEGSPKMH